MQVDINEDNLEEVMASLQQVRAMRATNKLRLDSIKNGTSLISEEDIQTEILSARRERKND